MRYHKNRVTLFFNKEHTNDFRLFFATLEQVNTFLLYVKKCAHSEYLEYSFEALKGRDTGDDTWTVKDFQTVDANSDYVVHRTESAPFKICIHFYATKKTQECDFNLYCFSALDADFIANLISQSASTRYRAFRIQHFKRNRDTKEWEEREPMQLVPESLAEAYYELNPLAREQAVKTLSELPSLA